MRRVLMISPHFPPDSSAGTHRVRLLAPHLETYGWRPTVLTVDPRDYESRLDAGLATLVPSGLEVIRTRAVSPGVARRVGLGDLGLRALPGLARAAWRLCRGQRFDAVFITIYPTYPAILGPLLKRHFGIPFVLDYQDPWVGAWGLDVGGGANGAVDLKSRVTRSLASRLEPHVLAAADGVTAVSARTYEDACARVGATPRVTAEIPIGWDPADLKAHFDRMVPRAFVPRDGRTHFVYTGTVLQAARLVRDRSPELADAFRFHFFGTSNQTAGGPPRVGPHAEAAGVSDLVREHPPRLDYLDALTTLREADILLLLGSTEPHYTASKVFPSLLAERRLLGVYHEASTAVDILARAAGGSVDLVTFGDRVSVGDRVPAIAEALERAIRTAASPVRIERSVLEPWSARRLAERLADVYDRVAA
jgi:glycosyltransferase involved in cell wall biosynthesis